MVWKLPMSRLASVPRIGAAAITIAGAAVFCSLELSEIRQASFRTLRNFARNITHSPSRCTLGSQGWKELLLL